ncbi:MAG: hypothetical protein JWP88_1354 [Flaviaesturariibacter sp.]|nr:hypothetical protein [Flaviaesturariibacter sp.]
MYTQIWNKYLPIIRILLKRSATTADQVLSLNREDFERGGAARKSGYKFRILLSKGQLDNVLELPLAKDLSQVIRLDPAMKALLEANDFAIHMNSKFQLSLDCSTRLVLEEAVVITEPELAA